MVGCNFAEGLSDAFAAQLSFKVVFLGTLGAFKKLWQIGGFRRSSKSITFLFPFLDTPPMDIFRLVISLVVSTIYQLLVNVFQVNRIAFSWYQWK